MSYSSILIEKHGAIVCLKLNRPEALNALNNQMMGEVRDALEGIENDDEIKVIVLTGSDKAFAAGADIKEIADQKHLEMYDQDFIAERWEMAARCKKPVIAAVAGYALGGGCELAMMCDYIIAADNAKFGQPELSIGVIPGAGGTQRLTRFVGKSKAMDMILTGRMMEADEAERCGLVSRVVSVSELLTEALSDAEKIAKLSQTSVKIAKECVNEAYETSMTAGIRFERRIFQALFGSRDQKEGMSAFIEKRPAKFKD